MKTFIPFITLMTSLIFCITGTARATQFELTPSALQQLDGAWSMPALDPSGNSPGRGAFILVSGGENNDGLEIVMPIVFSYAENGFTTTFYTSIYATQGTVNPVAYGSILDPLDPFAAAPAGSTTVQFSSRCSGVLNYRLSNYWIQSFSTSIQKIACKK